MAYSTSRSAASLTASVSETRNPRLPIELIEHTISFLWESPTSLCSCALTCKTLLPYSRRMLFTNVFLPSRTSFEALRLKAKKSSFIRSYLCETKALYVDESAWPWHAHWAALFRDITDTTLGFGPGSDCNSFEQTFGSHMTNLHSVQLKGMHWDILPPEPTQTILPFPTVKALELFGCKFRNLTHLERLIHAFPRLERLRLEGCEWRTWYDKRIPASMHTRHDRPGLDNPDVTDEGELLRGPRLVELAVKTSEACDDLLSWISSTQSCTSIRTLSLHSSKRDLFNCPDPDGPLRHLSQSIATRFVRMLGNQFGSLEEMSIVMPDCLEAGCQGQINFMVSLWDTQLTCWTLLFFIFSFGEPPRNARSFTEYI